MAHSMIHHIVRIRQMLLRWRNRSVPSDVPSGHVAVSVGSGCKRFVVPATHLNHPAFKMLLVKAEEEYGFGNWGPLVLPCDETVFEHILRIVDLGDRDRSCHMEESKRLLNEFAEKSVF